MKKGSVALRASWLTNFPSTRLYYARDLMIPDFPPCRPADNYCGDFQVTNHGQS